MKQDFFKFLSQEIMINILSRLPVRTTKSCKCVCKPWLGLIESHEFAKSYLSKSVRSLAIVEGKTSYRIVEFVDEAGVQNFGHHFHVVLDMKFSHDHESLHSSVNGLLFLFNVEKGRPRDLIICNPMTREYVNIPPPTETSNSPDVKIEHDAFGFGVSKTSGLYKLVRIFHQDSKVEGVTQTQPMCEVFTLGTKSWRSIAADSQLEYKNAPAAFVNGKLHWLVFEPNDKPHVSCLDLETEVFTSFYPPFQRRSWGHCLSVLRDRLCFSDSATSYEIVVWLMKNKSKKRYGDSDSWSRMLTIKRPPCSDDQFREFLPVHIGVFSPIKVFGNGDILLDVSCSTKLFCYSKKTKKLRECEVDEARWSEYCAKVVIYTPSFASLETLGVEDVSLFSDV